MNSTLISADNHWALFAVIVSVAYFSIWAEKTKWGSRLSAVVIAILGTLVLSNLSVIPADAPSYGIVWSYFVPLAIPLLLFKANLKRIFREAGPTLLAFTFGTIGTLLGTLTAFSLIPLGAEGWKLAGIFCATYIGGSMNFVAVSEALKINSPELLAAGIAADNLVMAVYFIVLFALPSSKLLQRFYTSRRADNISGSKDEAASAASNSVDLFNLAKSLSIGLIISAAGFYLEDLSGIKGTGILFITAIVVFAATVFSKHFEKIKGADMIGTFFMQMFFAAIGAGANIMIVLKFGPVLFLFAALILLIHLLFLLAAGKLFKLDLREIVIASNANMGGPTTAAAMAAARNWNALVIPAILSGTLGYAVATFIGVAAAYWLK